MDKSISEKVIESVDEVKGIGESFVDDVAILIDDEQIREKGNMSIVINKALIAIRNQLASKANANINKESAKNMKALEKDLDNLWKKHSKKKFIFAVK